MGSLPRGLGHGISTAILGSFMLFCRCTAVHFFAELGAVDPVSGGLRDGITKQLALNKVGHGKLPTLVCHPNTCSSFATMNSHELPIGPTKPRKADPPPPTHCRLRLALPPITAAFVATSAPHLPVSRHQREQCANDRAMGWRRSRAAPSAGHAV